MHNRNTIIITGVVMVVILISSLLYYSSHFNVRSVPVISKVRTLDRFGILEIYPTKIGGREWFINMEKPTVDGLFNPQSNISRQLDGSWRVGQKQTSGKFHEEVRMYVDTPPGEENWKNVEITGYARIAAVVTQDNGTTNDDLAWYARGGKHNAHKPCEGSAYIGGIYADGHVGWKKEIWFTGGYTNERAYSKVTDSIIGRWIGWKVVLYNIENDSAVKLESYLDNNGNNTWVKVSDLTDNGGWYAKASDSVFYSAHCDRTKDYIITNGGPLVTFRSDDMVWDWKDLSVREIKPPAIDSNISHS